MAKYAKGKKSFGISDIGGHKVPYNQLRTTWDNLRVASEEWSPKHPQLTPANNLFDAEALFTPRPDNSPEDVKTINLDQSPYVEKSAQVFVTEDSSTEGV